MSEIVQLTKEQAIEFYNSGAWKKMTDYGIVALQIYQDKLCVPFGEFHRAVEAVLGRPVYTHEFGLNAEGLISEFEGRKGKPSMEEILALIPPEKLIIVNVETP